MYETTRLHIPQESSLPSARLEDSLTSSRVVAGVLKLHRPVQYFTPSFECAIWGLQSSWYSGHGRLPQWLR